MVNGTILIADDEDLIRQVLHDTLTEQGYHVETVATGSQAWSAVQEQTFDLAFVDIRMPGLDGLDLLQKTQAAQIDPPNHHYDRSNHADQRHRGDEAWSL